MANPNFDSVIATTIKNYGPTLTDNIFKSRPLLHYLTKQNKPRMEDGGEQIVESIIHAVGNAGSYGGWDTINITPVETATAAQYDWKQVYGTIAISGIEKAKNSGKSRVHNLVEAKIMQAEETLKKNLGAMLFADGTGNGGKDFLGLAALVGDNAVGPAVVGGITVATDAYWRSKVTTIGTPPTQVTLTLDNLRKVYNDAAEGGNDVVDALFTTQTIFETYEGLLMPNVRYQDKTMANAGFTSLTFKGVPITYDPDCTADTVYGLNSKYIKLVGHKDVWFEQTPMTDGLAATSGGAGAATTVDGSYSLILAYGNLTARSRRRHFRLRNVK